MFITRSADKSVGPRFLSIDNTDLLALTQHFFNTNATVYTAKNNRKCFLKINIADLTVNVPELGGLLTPTVWVKNENTGRSALTVGVGLFRFICKNGLFLGVADFALKLKHLDASNTHKTLDLLPNLFSEAVKSLEKGTLIDLMLDAVEQQVLDPIDVVCSLNIANVVKENVLSLIEHKHYRTVDQPTNTWGLYNIVNEQNRKKTRSAFSFAEKDVGLLENIQLLATAQHWSKENVA